jgi:hypothetical protein
MGEEGEDTSRKSFTERIQRGSGRTSRSPVTVHGEERGEVGKKERRKNSGRIGIETRAPATLAPFLLLWHGLGSSWIPRAPPSLAPSYTPRVPGWLAPYAKVQMWKKFSRRYIYDKMFYRRAKIKKLHSDSMLHAI